MVKSISLKTREDIIKVNNIACSKPYNVTISCGYSSYDAKSLLSLFTLLGKSNCLLVLPDHLQQPEMRKILKQMKLA